MDNLISWIFNHLDSFLYWLVKLQTPAEWKATAQIGLFILVMTEAAKRVNRKIAKRYQASDVWFFSLAFGIVGAWYTWPSTSGAPFWFAGVVVAGVVSFIHRYAIVGLRWKAPGLAAIITGDKRKGNRGAPGGIERRKA